MRRRTLAGILFLSIAANVVLWLTVNRIRPHGEIAYETNSPIAIIATNRHVLADQPHSTKVTWQDLDASSIPNLIANLRAVKCPELTIRDIATARLDEQMDERIAEINQPLEFWSTALQKDRSQQEQREKVRVLARENERLVREWFGGDWNRDAYLYWVLDPYAEFRLGFLPREKAMAVEYDILSLAQAAEAAFKGRDIAPPGDYRELERLGAQLKSKLSPAEYAELNLRSLVELMHYGGFPDVPLSGADVRYILTLYARHLDFIDYYLKSSREFDELKKNAKAIVQQDIRNYLGPERYVEFQRADSFEYPFLHKLTLAAGLSPETAKKVFSLKADALRQALAISKNSSLAADARDQQLNDLRNTCRAAVTDLLGEKTMKDYAYASGAWWDKLGRE